jgi:hypothetical protein
MPKFQIPNKKVNYFDPFDSWRLIIVFYLIIEIWLLRFVVSSH